MQIKVTKIFLYHHQVLFLISILISMLIIHLLKVTVPVESGFVQSGIMTFLCSGRGLLLMVIKRISTDCIVALIESTRTKVILRITAAGLRKKPRQTILAAIPLLPSMVCALRFHNGLKKLERTSKRCMIQCIVFLIGLASQPMIFPALILPLIGNDELRFLNRV